VTVRTTVRHAPRKRLGQHFLTDPSIARRIVDALGAEGPEPVVEIGPGRGILTGFLAGRGMPLVAVEKDRDLARSLADRYREADQVRVVPGDILEFDPAPLLEETGADRFHVAGNIPFQITSPLFDWLLERRHRIGRAVLMLQREVAGRIASPPGNRTYGRLSVVVRYFVRVEPLFTVRRGSFFPVPDVDAAVLRIDFRPPPDVRRALDEEAFVRLVRTLFGWRRKQLRKTLRAHPDLALGEGEMERLAGHLPFSLTRRPEELAVDEFVDLANRIFRLRGR
jgi:16S rRNA (adenine1518-N6/adenine1519-N6)-dimethyltransferase